MLSFGMPLIKRGVLTSKPCMLQGNMSKFNIYSTIYGAGDIGLFHYKAQSTVRPLLNPLRGISNAQTSIINRSYIIMLNSRRYLNLKRDRTAHFSVFLLTMSYNLAFNFKYKALTGLGLTVLAITCFPGVVIPFFLGGFALLGISVYRTVKNINRNMDILSGNSGTKTEPHRQRSGQDSTRWDVTSDPFGPLLMAGSLGVFKKILTLFTSILERKASYESHIQTSVIDLIQLHVEKNTYQGSRLRSLLNSDNFQEPKVLPIHFGNITAVNHDSSFQVKFVISNGPYPLEVSAQGHANESGGAHNVILSSVTVSSMTTGEQIYVPIDVKGPPPTSQGPIKEAEYREL